MEQYKTEVEIDNNKVSTNQREQGLHQKENIMTLLDMVHTNSKPCGGADYINTFQLELLDDDSSDTAQSASPYSTISEASSLVPVQTVNTTKIRYELFRQLPQVALRELDAMLMEENNGDVVAPVTSTLPLRKRKFDLIENEAFHISNNKYQKIPEESKTLNPWDNDYVRANQTIPNLEEIDLIHYTPTAVNNLNKRAPYIWRNECYVQMGNVQ